MTETVKRGPSALTVLRQRVRMRDLAGLHTWVEQMRQRRGALGPLRKAVHHAVQAGWDDGATLVLPHIADQAPLRDWVAWLNGLRPEVGKVPTTTRWHHALMQQVPVQLGVLWGLLHHHPVLMQACMARGAKAVASPHMWQAEMTAVNCSVTQRFRHRRCLVTLRQFQDSGLAWPEDPALQAWMATPTPPEIALDLLRSCLQAPAQLHIIHEAMQAASSHPGRDFVAWEVWNAQWATTKPVVDGVRQAQALERLLDEGLSLHQRQHPRLAETRMRTIQALTADPKVTPAVRSAFEHIALTQDMPPVAAGAGVRKRL